MSAEAHKETLEFKTEVSEVLNLVIRSLYSNKEIFLRELVSNASDAAEKLRFEALGDDELYESDPDLRIRVSLDKDARTVTVTDNGIGMSRQEVMETIGTIASSGTKKFVEAITGDESEDNRLIGQFGVGFYSSYIVADKVTIETRRAGLTSEHGVRWESTGEAEYSIENIERPERGTSITLHLREEEDEFLDSWRLRSIISKFSDHVALPIQMLSEPTEEDAEPEWEQVNKGTALWMRPKNEITEEEYNTFYQHVSHDFSEPLAHVHNRVEGNNEYSSLLYVPSQAPYDLYDPNQKHGVKLYVKRVFIMDEADKLMPRFLRFVKGVVDSDDLPLNVSREILQHNRKIDSIRGANVKRILGLLEKMAKNDAEKYQKFWEVFGTVLKEGPAEDSANAQRIAGLLRFATTASDSSEQTTSFADYIERMQEGQDKIYYLTAETWQASKNSPHLEIFRKKGIEVLLLTDRVDEWLVSNLADFDGKALTSVARGDIDLEGDKESDDSEEKKDEKENAVVLERLKEMLGDKVKEVRASSRLVDSPACLVADENDMSQNLARILKQMGQDAPESPPILEVNLDHLLVKRVADEEDETAFEDLASILFDQALLAEGGRLEDPGSFVKRLNQLLLSLGS
ncbi:molecular chaperone HtpG [Solemya velum gill symbiont]|uniref:Chaperone protein HtpG n=1 Tax=Solemya velum gill symbiont TaxID=2340 RepID=A0A0B0HET2_SOVGS|nr:molecular chaperone HtpG [Solemya velum gill symbiont]KHF25961.1 HSP90 molecular chaperone [Solemya velum gill symbiont]OOY51493.1 molecular chaperone HtpG [Solemya velum gill symbiont]OOY55435.1 molecular chaperone HtpG [Solemya velum gill symbiont]OOY56721.1 molecular chaperone HtpG [Solemya velum gill symbiont]OOY62221.1 molecular chaperone HtpG [Solemya velum gill symbiont]